MDDAIVSARIKIKIITSREIIFHLIQPLLESVEEIHFDLERGDLMSLVETGTKTSPADVALVDLGSLAESERPLLNDLRMPFILMTDSLSEYPMNAALEAGAQDCLDMNGLEARLLVHSIRGAISRFMFKKKRKTNDIHVIAQETDIDSDPEGSATLARLLAQSAQPVGIGLLDGTIGYVNAAFLDLVGYTRSELGNMSWVEITPREYDEVERRSLAEITISDHPVRYEKEYIRKDGSRIPVELLVHAVKDKNRNLLYYFAIVNDTTNRKRSESELQRSEALLKQSEKMARTGGWEYIPQTNSFFWTDGTYDIYNLPIDRTVDPGNVAYDCYLPDDRPRIRDAFERCMRQGEPYDLEFRFIAMKGIQKWIRTAGKPVMSNGVISRVIGTIQDITTLKEKEERLSVQDLRLQKLTAQLPGMLYQFMKSPEGTYSVPYTSDSIREIFGCSPRDVQHGFEPILRVVLPEDIDDLLRSIEESAVSLKPWKHEFRVRVPGAAVRWMLGHSVPERLADASILWHGYNVDITEQKEREKELQFKSLLLDASIDSVFVHDERGKLFYINETAWKSRGYTRSELMARNLHEIDSHDTEPLILDRMRMVRQLGQATFEAVHVHKDGSRIPYEVHVGITTILGQSLFFSVCRDISERKIIDAALKKALEEVKAERDKARQYLDIARTILVALDARGRISLLNKKGAQILEIDQNEAIGLDWFDNFIKPCDREVLRAYNREIFTGAVKIDDLAHENVIVSKNGRDIIVLWQNSPLYDAAGNVIGSLSSGEDITDRKVAEKALRENDARLRLTLSATNIGLFDLDLATGTTITTPEYVSMLGYSPGEILPTLTWWRASLHPEDLYHVEAILDECKSGRRVDYSIEYRLLTKAGTWRWIRSIGKVIQSEASAGPTRLLGIHQDITDQKDTLEMLEKALDDRKQAQRVLQEMNQELEQRVESRTKELKMVQEKNVRQEKLAIIGKIAGSVSHELRNPLGTISNSIYYLKTKLADADERIKKHVAYIQDEVTRASKIVSDLLDFARTKPEQGIELDLAAMIDDLLAEIEPPQRVRIVKHYESKLPRLTLDRRKIQQVFTNLIVNALQAMPDEGSLEITITRAGGHIAIAIKDTGQGISPDNLKQIFEPLFTTKMKGIGLGLTVVKDIVDFYNGTIKVESVLGEGTTFTVFLPIVVVDTETK